MFRTCNDHFKYFRIKSTIKGEKESLASPVVLTELSEAILKVTEEVAFLLL